MSPPSEILNADQRRAALAREVQAKSEARAEEIMKVIGGFVVFCLLVTSALLSLAVVVWAGRLLWRVTVRG